MKNLIKKFIPSFLLSWYHFLLAFFGAVIYGFPGKKLKVIGITGTKGKSTTVILAGKILEEAGFKIGWITSATLKIGEREWLNPFHLTMPGRFFIQKFLRESIKSGCQYCLIEITSEGILQYRHKFIDFEATVFTNLAPEHIEAHKGFENYRRAKGNFFQASKKIHILNLDDKNAEYFLRFPAEQKIGFTASKNRGLSSVIEAEDIKIGPGGARFSVKNIEFNLNLLGEFNLSNALAAICVAFSQGIGMETCKKALEKVKGIPGRLEIISEEQSFTVIVDLAHTPDSFEKVFNLVKDLPHNKIISVFGSAGGGRDKWKRPELGKIAARYSDYIILTNEDPYDENPSQILSDIKSGISNFQFPEPSLYEILDRREAIKKALVLAKLNDIVLFLGKGTEQTMITDSKKIPWDERQVVREELQKLFQPELKKYEILEHKADLKIRVFGKTKEELFLNALLAMTESMRPAPEKPAKKISRRIKINSPDLSALLVDFLSEVLYLTQVNKEIYNKTRFKKFSDAEIEAEISGQKAERFGQDIKAVTHHGLDIVQKNGIWETTILFDI